MRIYVDSCIFMYVVVYLTTVVVCIVYIANCNLYSCIGQLPVHGLECLITQAATYYARLTVKFTSSGLTEAGRTNPLTNPMQPEMQGDKIPTPA